MEERKNGIGSSEVATVLGINPWETPYQLWLRKTGQTPAKEENFAMKAGHYLEDSVARFFEDETGCKVIKRSAIDWIAVDKDRPFLRVSPDRTYWLKGEKHNSNNKGILECKTTQMQIDEDNIPKHWYCQVQYQLGVMGLQHGSLAWLTAGRKFGWVNIEFNPKLYAYMVEKLVDFWMVNVMKCVAPACTTSNDVLIQNFMHKPGKFTEATSELAECYIRLKTAKEEAASILEAVKADEEKLKMAIGDAEGLTYQGETIATWKAPMPKKEVDTKTMIAENPELAKKYMVEKISSRRFLLK